MSIRTIIEVNHDFLYALENDPQEWRRLIDALHSSAFNAELNKGETPRVSSAIRILGQRHHSEQLKIVVK